MREPSKAATEPQATTLHPGRFIRISYWGLSAEGLQMTTALPYTMRSILHHGGRMRGGRMRPGLPRGARLWSDDVRCRALTRSRKRTARGTLPWFESREFNFEIQLHDVRACTVNRGVTGNFAGASGTFVFVHSGELPFDELVADITETTYSRRQEHKRRKRDVSALVKWSPSCVDLQVCITVYLLHDSLMMGLLGF